MVVFIAFLQTTKDRDGADFIGLINHHGLETTFQGFVLFEIFLIFVEGGSTDAAQFASCQCRFQDVGCIHGTLALAGTNERMNLVDEEDDTSVRSCHLINNAFQAFLELALVFRTSHQCTHIQREELLVLQILGHVATYDTLGQTFNDGCLTCTGLANQDGVVLCAARENLQHATNLVITSDDGVELTLTGQVNEVFSIFLQRLIVVVSALTLHTLPLTEFEDSLTHILLVGTRVFHHTAHGGVDD